MVDKVRSLLGSATSVRIGTRRNEFGGFLPDFLQPEVAITEQQLGIASIARCGDANAF
jgi:hypothetical protein